MDNRTFLVLTDFSPATEYVMTYAATLAEVVGAHLHLLYVRPAALPPEHVGPALLTDEEVTAAAAERTAHLRVPATVEVAAGLLSDALTAALQRQPPALVVLGDHATAEDATTTTALSLLNPALVPLLLLPPNNAWTVPPQQVVLAADKQPVLLRPSATLMLELLRTLDPQLTVVHVVEPEDDDSCATCLEMLRHSGLLDGLSHVRPKGFRDLHTAHGIQQAATENCADLLIVQARQRTWWSSLFSRSVTQQLVQQHTLPLLILPTTD